MAEGKSRAFPESSAVGGSRQFSLAQGTAPFLLRGRQGPCTEAADTLSRHLDRNHQDTDGVADPQPPWAGHGRPSALPCLGDPRHPTAGAWVGLREEEVGLGLGPSGLEMRLVGTGG